MPHTHDELGAHCSLLDALRVHVSTSRGVRVRAKDCGRGLMLGIGGREQASGPRPPPLRNHRRLDGALLFLYPPRVAQFGTKDTQRRHKGFCPTCGPVAWCWVHTTCQVRSKPFPVFCLFLLFERTLRLSDCLSPHNLDLDVNQTVWVGDTRFLECNGCCCTAASTRAPSTRR